MANYISTSANAWCKLNAEENEWFKITAEDQMAWKYANNFVATVENNTITYVIKDRTYGQVPILNAGEEEMAASQSKAPILQGLINAGLLGKSLETLIIATSAQISKYLPNAGYCRVNFTSGTDPLSPNRNQWSQAQTFSIALILYRIDDVDHLIRKANIVREALTSLHQNYVRNSLTGNKMPPQVIIISSKSSAEELVDIAIYAGANWAEELKLEDVEGACVITSLLEKY